VSDVPLTADPGETPTGTAKAGVMSDPTSPDLAAADVPPELLAQSLGQYFRAWWARVRGEKKKMINEKITIEKKDIKIEKSK